MPETLGAVVVVALAVDVLALAVWLVRLWRRCPRPRIDAAAHREQLRQIAASEYRRRSR